MKTTGWLIWVSLAGSALATPPLSGTFIQLSRSNAVWSAEAWGQALDRVRDAGLDTVVIQYVAEPGLSYFEDRSATEDYPVLDRLLPAASERNLSVFLGLTHDPDYWTHITARDVVLRDYFLTRVAEAERLQQALLRRFGSIPCWVGYYVADEIDDLHWREEGRRAILGRYLGLLHQRLREHDRDRLLIGSAFFRGRTAPDVFARMLASVTASGPGRLDAILVQDGAGAQDPPGEYAPIYFQEIRAAWPASGPELWAVLELFDQQSKGVQPFHAVPATAERFAAQWDAVTGAVDRVVLFTLSDYARPGSELNESVRARASR